MRPFLVACFLVCLLADASWAEPGLVWAEVTTDLGRQDVIRVTYPHAVGGREARQDFQNLARWGRWTPAIPVEDGTFDIVRGCDTYTAKIPAQGAIVGATAALPWEVFVFTFRRFSGVNVVFDIGSPFFYRGPVGKLENEFVALSVQALPESRLYAVRSAILSDSASQPSELSAGLRALEAPRDNASEPGLLQRTRQAPPLMLALLLICGLLLGLSSYLLITATRGRQRR